MVPDEVELSVEVFRTRISNCRMWSSDTSAQVIAMRAAPWLQRFKTITYRPPILTQFGLEWPGAKLTTRYCSAAEFQR